MGKQNTGGEVVGTLAWQKWENNPSQSTTLQTWQSAFSRTANPVAAGVYKISWYFELRIVPVSQLNSRAAGRFSFDDGGGAQVKGNFIQDTEEWCGYSGWDFINSLVVGDQPILAVEWRRDPTVGGNDNIEIRKIKMAIEQMGPQ